MERGVVRAAVGTLIVHTMYTPRHLFAATKQSMAIARRNNRRRCFGRVQRCSAVARPRRAVTYRVGIGVVGDGGGEKIDSVRLCRLARVRAGQRRALAAIPEAGQFVLSARFVMPSVVLPTHHCIAATNTTTTTKKSPSAVVTIAAAAVASNNATVTTTLYWLPVVDSPTCCFCCYCGGRLFVTGNRRHRANTTGFFGSAVGRLVDARSPPSRDYGRLYCGCYGTAVAAATAAAAVVLLVPYVLGPPCFRPIVLPPAFVAAANHHLRHHRRRVHQPHRLYNTAVAGTIMETR